MTYWKTLTLKISSEDHRQIKRLSADPGKSIKDLMLEALHRLISEYREAERK